MPDPPIAIPNEQAPPTGVYGSLERIMMFSEVASLLPTVDDPDLGKVANVWLYERPEQATPYPCMIILSGRSSMIDEDFEGHKLESFPAVIEVFGESDNTISEIDRSVQRVLEDERVANLISLWIGALRTEGDCGVVVYGNGRDFDREHKRYSSSGLRTYVVRSYWEIHVKYRVDRAALDV